MTDDEIRAAFETAFQKIYPTYTDLEHWFRREGDGSYRNNKVDERWQMWQAAWIAAGARIVELELELAEYKARLLMRFSPHSRWGGRGRGGILPLAKMRHRQI